MDLADELNLDEDDKEEERGDGDGMSIFYDV